MLGPGKLCLVCSQPATPCATASLTALCAPNFAGKCSTEALPKKNRALRAPQGEAPAARRMLDAAVAAAARAPLCVCWARWGRRTLFERSPQRCFIAPRLVCDSFSGVSSVGACVRAHARAPWRAAAHGRLVALSRTQKTACKMAKMALNAAKFSPPAGRLGPAGPWLSQKPIFPES